MFCGENVLQKPLQKIYEKCSEQLSNILLDTLDSRKAHLVMQSNNKLFVWFTLIFLEKVASPEITE